MSIEFRAVEDSVRMDGVIASSQTGEHQHQHAPLHRSPVRDPELIKRDPYKPQLRQAINIAALAARMLKFQLLYRSYRSDDVNSPRK